MENNQTDTTILQKPLGKWPLRAIIAEIVMFLLFGIFTIGRSWIEGQVSALGLCVLLLLFAGAVIFTLMQQEVIPWGQKAIPHWLQPRVLGTIATAIVLAMGVVFSAIPILENKVGVEAAVKEINERLGRIETKVDDVGETTDTIKADTGEIKEALGVGRESLIRQKINGVWGEPGCTVTYRFSLNDSALTIESVASPLGLDPYVAEFTINADEDLASAGPAQSQFSTTEQKGFFPGMSVKFLMEDNGNSQTLTWTHQGQFQNPLRLEKCGL